ncbi:MAG: 3-oxoacyl-ACP reductase FabG [Deltaproteobacteria bacterium]|jgi:3-oxoacyl-[acyl-carrier protein] reductase|nr:3-oxoacyl-ACP reductase FabG [Deltaproteobacteria bacterium]MDA8307780.1 3-oxoacyl-ACP reductase FabG [Deltaproteobacteria bacterium]
MRLSGKVAIVTGGAKGLGRAFCLGLAREGAKVVAVTRKDMDNLDQTVKMVRSLGGEAEMVRADVSSEADAKNMVQATIERFGRVDVLINNAAVYDGIKRKPFFEIDLAEWDLVMNVNVKGAFIATRAVFPYMKEQGYGKIVNLASEVFFTGSNGFAHYVASKGGIIGLTRALAVELGPHQICINCIAPGFTDTEASRGLADVSRYDVSKTPLHRLERPEDLVGAALFLASAESDFITGQTLLIDGGRAMH